MLHLLELGFSYSEALELTWVEAKNFIQAAALFRKVRLLDLATAVRAGMSDKRNWQDFIDRVSRG